MPRRSFRAYISFTYTRGVPYVIGFRQWVNKHYFEVVGCVIKLVMAAAMKQQCFLYYLALCLIDVYDAYDAQKWEIQTGKEQKEDPNFVEK